MQLLHTEQWWLRSGFIRLHLVHNRTAPEYVLHANGSCLSLEISNRTLFLLSSLGSFIIRS